MNETLMMIPMMIVAATGTRILLGYAEDVRGFVKGFKKTHKLHLKANKNRFRFRGPGPRWAWNWYQWQTLVLSRIGEPDFDVQVVRSRTVRSADVRKDLLRLAVRSAVEHLVTQACKEKKEVEKDPTLADKVAALLDDLIREIALGIAQLHGLLAIYEPGSDAQIEAVSGERRRIVEWIQHAAIRLGKANLTDKGYTVYAEQFKSWSDGAEAELEVLMRGLCLACHGLESPCKDCEGCRCFSHDCEECFRQGHAQAALQASVQETLEAVQAALSATAQ